MKVYVVLYEFNILDESKQFVVCGVYDTEEKAQLKIQEMIPEIHENDYDEEELNHNGYFAWNNYNGDFEYVHIIEQELK